MTLSDSRQPYKSCFENLQFIFVHLPKSLQPNSTQRNVTLRNAMQLKPGMIFSFSETKTGYFKLHETKRSETK